MVLLLRQITHAAIPPNSASRNSDTTVMITEVPNALQNSKCVFVVTSSRFCPSCWKLTPLKEIGFAVISAVVFAELITTR